METEPERVIYTIGHSNKSFEALLLLLKMHDIDVLADVRSAPYTKYAIHFNMEPLKAAVENAGLKYVFMGKQLGGKPKDPTLYDEEGNVRYDIIAQSEAFQAGIERLLTGVKSYRIALMCGEENPAGCHRRNLIAPALHAHSIEVRHIRSDGALQSEEDFIEREVPPDAVQLGLFSTN